MQFIQKLKLIQNLVYLVDPVNISGPEFTFIRLSILIFGFMNLLNVKSPVRALFLFAAYNADQTNCVNPEAEIPENE